MSPATLYKIASLLLLFFAIAHTKGLFNRKRLSKAALALRDKMSKLHFNYMGADASWGGFYVGFGLLATLFLLFSAFFAWQMATLVPAHPGELKALAWGFAAAQLGNCYLSWRYFFAPPGIIASLVTLCLGLAAWQA